MYNFIFIFILFVLTSTYAWKYKIHASDSDYNGAEKVALKSRWSLKTRDALISDLANCLEKNSDILKCFAINPETRKPGSKTHVFDFKALNPAAFFRDTNTAPYKPPYGNENNVIFITPKRRNLDLDFIKNKILRNSPSSSDRSFNSDEPNEVEESYKNNKKHKKYYSSANSWEDPRETHKREKKKKNTHHKREHKKRNKNRKWKKRKIIESTVEGSYQENDSNQESGITPESKYAYMQGPSRIINYRRRLPYFLPKRYHWSQEEILKLKNYWIDGPQSKYWGHHKTPY